MTLLPPVPQECHLWPLSAAQGDTPSPQMNPWISPQTDTSRHCRCQAKAAPGDPVSRLSPALGSAGTWHSRCQPLAEGERGVDGGGGHQRIRLLALLVLVGSQGTLAGSSTENLQRTATATGLLWEPGASHHHQAGAAPAIGAPLLSPLLSIGFS